MAKTAAPIVYLTLSPSDERGEKMTFVVNPVAGEDMSMSAKRFESNVIKPLVHSHQHSGPIAGILFTYPIPGLTNGEGGAFKGTIIATGMHDKIYNVWSGNPMEKEFPNATKATE